MRGKQETHQVIANMSITLEPFSYLLGIF
jgi:hypothetical protein